jgi:Skp family chaperone for outer membrane proteins
MQPLRTFVLIIIGLLTSTMALSDAIDPSVASLKDPLSLSEQQTQDLSKIFKEARDKLQSLRKEMKAINKNKQAQIDAVLTPDQKKKYEEIKNPSLPPESEPPQVAPMGSEPEQPPAK